MWFAGADGKVLAGYLAEVSTMNKLSGAEVLDLFAAWISKWVVFSDVPTGQAVIAALWVMHTWFAPKWPATAYAHITADGPGCGKSTALEVMASLSLNPKCRSTLRALEVVRGIKQTEGNVTYLFDEAEKLSKSAASDERSILTSGYKRGATHGISVGEKSVEFVTYCAKLFASIGALEDVFTSRSIKWRLSYGVPMRSWTDAAMTRDAEARGMIDLLVALFPNRSSVPAWVPAEWAEGREREIWTPIWSVALALGLSAEKLAEVRRTAKDMIEYKRTMGQKVYRDLRVEPKDEEREYAVRVVRDLASVLPVADKVRTGDIHTVTALAALKGLPDGPWRVFRGKGLDDDALAQLLSRFEVPTSTLVRELRGRKGRPARGYRGADILKAALTIEGPAKV